MRRISPAIGAFLLAGALVAPVWGAGPAQAADCKPSGQSSPGNGNGNPNTGQGAPNQPGGGTNSQPAPGVPAFPTEPTPASVLVGVLQGYLDPCPAG